MMFVINNLESCVSTRSLQLAGKLSASLAWASNKEASNLKAFLTQVNLPACLYKLTSTYIIVTLNNENEHIASRYSFLVVFDSLSVPDSHLPLASRCPNLISPHLV